VAAHQDLRLLCYFVEVVRVGSVRGAAESLRITPAVVSEALSHLEKNLGVTLLQRTTRTMRLTQVGERVFEKAATMTSAADEALRLAQNAAEQPKGDLYLTLPGELSMSWLPRKLRQFQNEHPSVRVHLVVDDNPVALEQSPFDLAIRANFVREPDEAPDVVCNVPLECVCTPDHLRQGATIEETLNAVGLIGRPASETAKCTVPFAKTMDGKTNWTEVAVPCRFQSSEHVVMHRLALEGFGGAVLMRTTVEDDLSQRRLVKVSDDCVFGYAAVKIIVRDRYPTAAARAMHAHLRQWH